MTPLIPVPRYLGPVIIIWCEDHVLRRKLATAVHAGKDHWWWCNECMTPLLP